MSPKKQAADPGPESPLKWCRQALDHRSPETEMACRTLISRLDQSKASVNRRVKKGGKKNPFAHRRLWPQIKLQIELRARGVPSVHLPCFYLLLTLVSVSHQTPFIIKCSGAPAAGRRSSTAAILTPALNDNTP